MALELGMVCVGGFSAEFGFEQASLLLSGEARPTAIIAGGLDMLPGVLRAVQQRRITVPQELSLVGMGGTMWAELCSPPVGVVRWDFDDLGRISAKLLFERIDQRGQDRPRRFVFPTEFLPRGSCAPPKASIES
jgi:LacI family transcriptional regulator